ncbi:MAG: hypothetical protein QM756_07985 [Polyangiaceae bacterium]
MSPLVCVTAARASSFVISPRSFKWSLPLFALTVTLMVYWRRIAAKLRQALLGVETR